MERSAEGEAEEHRDGRFLRTFCNGITGVSVHQCTHAVGDHGFVEKIDRQRR